MNQSTILVSGATGRTGGAAIDELLQMGKRVRAYVRSDDERAAALRARGVDIAVGDFTDIDHIRAAMEGEKNLPGLREMAMQFMPRGTQEELRDQLIDTALDRACLQDPLPDDDAGFHTRRDEGRSRLTLLAQEIARLVGQILGEYASVTKKLVQAKSFAAAHADMQSQLDGLIGKRFVVDTPYTQLAHFPRYLKAMTLRIDKLKADPSRDARQFAEFQPLLQNYQRAVSQRGGVLDPRLSEFRWLLEELRVSLFAQELRTPMPVSVKRLHKVWESMQR